MACLFSPDFLGCYWSLFWGHLPDWARWGLGFCTLLVAFGLVWRVRDALALVKRVAGWPGVAGIVGAVGILIAVFRPRARRADDPVEHFRPGDRDAAPPVPRPRARRPTLIELLRRRSK